MHTLIQILSISLLLALATVGKAQTPAKCGIVDIDGPSRVPYGEPLVLKARLTGVSHLANLETRWKLSVGTIISGQGTAEIKVDTVNFGGQNITATAELSGAPVDCNASASKTTEVEPPLACGLAFDQYGDIRFNDEKARLDNFAIQILNFPLSKGYLFATAGQVTFKNEARERLDRAKKYLVNVRRVDPNRLVTVDCGFTSDLSVTLYVVPPASSAPVCDIYTPVPLTEVRFTKPRSGSSKKRR